MRKFKDHIKIKKHKHLLNLKKYIGKPYKENGRGPDNYDCWGIVKVVAELIEIELPDLYLPDVMNDDFINDKKKLFVKLDKPEPYAIVADFWYAVPDHNNGGMVIHHRSGESGKTTKYSCCNGDCKEGFDGGSESCIDCLKSDEGCQFNKV